MIYIKFTDIEGNEMYSKINANKERIDFAKLKDFLCAKTLKEISEEEYDTMTDDDEAKE